MKPNKNFQKLVVKVSIVCFCLLLLLNKLFSQPNINRIEYYVDADPGLGNAVNVSFAGTNDINTTFTFNSAALVPGVHSLGMRSRDINGMWSHDNKWLFFKPYLGAAVPQPNISRVEWYVDADPGYGNATAISISAGQDLSGLSFIINTIPQSQSTHVIGARSLDANGTWSHDTKWIYLKPYSASPAVPNINRIEYYIDHDPGYGKAITIPFTAGTNIANLQLSADISTVYNGPHKLFIRSMDAAGNWSMDNKFDFTGGTSTLPVHFLNFYLMAERTAVGLYWATSSEINSKKFVVQRSRDWINFTDIGSVSAAGNKSTQSDYYFQDVEAMKYGGSTFYYRLQEVDLDGHFIVTEIHKISIGGKSDLKIVSTNSSETVLQYDSRVNGQAMLKVIDASGKTVIQYISFVNSGTNQIRVNTSALAVGVYFMELVHEGVSEVLKVLK